MRNEELFLRVKRVVQQFHVSADRITEDARIQHDLGFDSFGLMELVSALEQEFCVRFEDDVLMGIQTIGQVIQLMEQTLPSTDSAVS